MNPPEWKESWREIVRDVDVVHVRPGDVVVLRLFSGAEADLEHIGESLQREFPEQRCLVLGPGADFTVYRRTHEPEEDLD